MDKRYSDFDEYIDNVIEKIVDVHCGSFDCTDDYRDSVIDMLNDSVADIECKQKLFYHLSMYLIGTVFMDGADIGIRIGVFKRNVKHLSGIEVDISERDMDEFNEWSNNI